MKVNSTWKGVGVEKITQRKACFVLSLKRQKSIQTQQQSHHRLTVPQAGETREEFSEINTSLVFCFFFKTPSFDKLKYLATALERDLLTTENQAFEMTVDISDAGLS